MLDTIFSAYQSSASCTPPLYLFSALMVKHTVVLAVIAIIVLLSRRLLKVLDTTSRRAYYFCISAPLFLAMLIETRICELGNISDMVNATFGINIFGMTFRLFRGHFTEMSELFFSIYLFISAFIILLNLILLSLLAKDLNKTLRLKHFIFSFLLTLAILLGFFFLFKSGPSLINSLRS